MKEICQVSKRKQFNSKFDLRFVKSHLHLQFYFDKNNGGDITEITKLIVFGQDSKGNCLLNESSEKILLARQLRVIRHIIIF